METKTPYDYTQTNINGVSLRDAYLNGKQAGIGEGWRLSEETRLDYYEAGIREVVEFVDSCLEVEETGVNEFILKLRQESWQAKLKEWGIDEEVKDKSNIQEEA